MSNIKNDNIADFKFYSISNQIDTIKDFKFYVIQSIIKMNLKVYFKEKENSTANFKENGITNFNFYVISEYFKFKTQYQI